MADLTSADVTVTMGVRDVNFTQQDWLRSYPTIAFGNGVKTYPTNGVPLPAKTTLGLRLGEVKRVNVTGAVDGLEYGYDYTNHTIRIWTAGVEHTGGATAVVAVTLYLEILGR